VKFATKRPSKKSAKSRAKKGKKKTNAKNITTAALARGLPGEIFERPAGGCPPGSNEIDHDGRKKCQWRAN
jgi:hypothetical protein